MNFPIIVYYVSFDYGGNIIIGLPERDFHFWLDDVISSLLLDSFNIYVRHLLEKSTASYKNIWAENGRIFNRQAYYWKMFGVNVNFLLWLNLEQKDDANDDSQYSL